MPADGNDSAPPPAQQPHNAAPTDNGVGGAPATHDQHAASVPVGKGMGDAGSQTAGNRAAHMYDSEHLAKHGSTWGVGGGNR